MPACLPLVSFFTGFERADMKFAQEIETSLFLNNDGGVTIQQEQHTCPSCSDEVTGLVCFGSAQRIRAIAKELLRLAEEIEAGAEDGEAGAVEQ